MDSERVLTGQTVLVEEGRITALGPVDHVSVPANALRVDGQGKFLMPGLADMHVHLAGTVDSVEMEYVLMLLLAHGVTTVRNMDYDPQQHVGIARVLRFRERAAAGTLLSPLIYTSGAWAPIQYSNANRFSDSARHVGPPPVMDSVEAYVAAYKATGYDFIKVHDESQEMIESVSAAAQRIGIPFLGHVPNGAGYEWALKVGYRSIEHLMGYRESLGIPEGTVVSDSTPIPELTAAAITTARAGVWNCPTLTMLQWGQAHWISINRRIVKALQNVGAGLLLGTDESLTNTKPAPNFFNVRIPSFSVQYELVALVRAGLTPYQALVTGTRNVAAYFGTLSESGTVAVGKRADLVLLDGNPLADITNTSRITGVMVAGRWLSRTEIDGRLAAYAHPLKFSK
jgi:imidazolonepropionase-like amidohydrolase